MLIGTLVNILSVIVGTVIGTIFQAKIPTRLKSIIFQGLGLVTLLLGFQMALKVDNIMVLIFSVLLGAIIGEAIDLDRYFQKFGDYIKNKIKSKSPNFTDGMVTAFLIYCVGSMTIVGAINEGINGDHSLLFAKSVLDGVTSIALSSIYGLGVAFSTLPMLIVQGGITILAHQAQGFFNEAIISQLTATGGILIVGIGFNLLKLKKVKVTNMLPSLITAVLLTYYF